MDVGILIKGGYRIDGMVNSRSDFEGILMKNRLIIDVPHRGAPSSEKVCIKLSQLRN